MPFICVENETVGFEALPFPVSRLMCFRVPSSLISKAAPLLAERLSLLNIHHISIKASALFGRTGEGLHLKGFTEMLVEKGEGNPLTYSY